MHMHMVKILMFHVYINKSRGDCSYNHFKLLVNSHKLVGNYNTLLGRAKRQSRASGKLEKRCFYKARIMAGVNIFISSTCYDLSQVRQDLHDIISGLGHNPMMSGQKSEIID